MNATLSRLTYQDNLAEMGDSGRTYQAFAVYFLQQAISNRDYAWLADCREQVCFWCEVAGVEPDHFYSMLACSCGRDSAYQRAFLRDAS